MNSNNDKRARELLAHEWEVRGQPVMARIIRKGGRDSDWTQAALAAVSKALEESAPLYPQQVGRALRRAPAAESPEEEGRRLAAEGIGLSDLWRRVSRENFQHFERVVEAFAEARTQPACTCPSGDGSLRWPCPKHPLPSAPAGEPEGDALSRALADAYAHGERRAPFAFADCARQIREALAQQPAAQLETAAALCEEAAQVLRAVGCSGVVLPEEWRWPLPDELEGTAATIRNQAQQPAAEDPPTFAVDRALAERFARVWCKETTTTRFEDLPEAGKIRCVDDFFLVLYLVFVRQEESA